MKNKKQKNHQGVDKFLVGIVVATLVLLAGVIYYGSSLGQSPQTTSEVQASMIVEDNKFSWGTIDINGGIVTKNFPIVNEGSTPLMISDVKTSCMCTTAQLRTDSQTSQVFGMHDKTSSVFEVQPGETAELIVQFDPAFHGPSGVGPISRTITMNTNDPNHSNMKFHLTANVVRK